MEFSRRCAGHSRPENRSSIAKPTVAPKQVVVKKTRASVTIKVTASGVTPSGKVTITGGGIAKQTVTLRNGRVAVKLPVFKTKGTRTLNVTYAGDSFVTGDNAKVTVKVKAKK